ncbi:MAG: GGDEF domain-containing protein [Candidatus Thiodiazotropha sp. 6PLUC4]
MLHATQLNKNGTHEPVQCPDSQPRNPSQDTIYIDSEISQLRERVTHLETEVSILRQDLYRERQQANIDALTGIPNRRAYQTRLPQDRARCIRENKKLCLLIWDIDHFKSINDQYGHWMGDRVISCIANKISQRLRLSDFVARIGGEEFAVLLSDCSKESAIELADHLRQEIAQCNFELECDKVNATISCGIAELTPDESDATLFTRADKALYRAKRAGRNRICCAP